MLLVIDLLDMVMNARLARPLTWLLRLLGALALVAGAWVWSSYRLFDLPAGLFAVGVLLIVSPDILRMLRDPEP